MSVRGWALDKQEQIQEVLVSSLTVLQDQQLIVQSGQKSTNPTVDIPLWAGRKSEDVVLLVQKSVVRSYLKGFVKFWPGCFRVREEPFKILGRQSPCLKQLRLKRLGLFSWTGDTSGEIAVGFQKHEGRCIQKLFTHKSTQQLVVLDWFKIHQESSSSATGLSVSGSCCPRRSWRHIYLVI